MSAKVAKEEVEDAEDTDDEMPVNDPYFFNFMRKQVLKKDFYCCGSVIYQMASSIFLVAS